MISLSECLFPIKMNNLEYISTYLLKMMATFSIFLYKLTGVGFKQLLCNFGSWNILVFLHEIFVQKEI